MNEITRLRSIPNSMAPEVATASRSVSGSIPLHVAARGGLSSVSSAVLYSFPGIRVGAGHRLFDWPSAPKPQFQRASVNAQRRLPLRNGHAFAIKFHKHVLALVVGLLATCRPATVSGFVVSIVVKSLDRVLGRGTRPHIRIEGGEVRPPLAYLDPAPAVVGELVIERIGAALAHAAPDVPFGGFGPTMRGETLNGAFAAEASTRASVAGSDAKPRQLDLISTVATEQPLRLSPCASSGFADANQAPKAETGHVLRSHNEDMGISLFDVNDGRRL